MQNYDSVNHPDWPYDIIVGPHELESCDYWMSLNKKWKDELKIN